MRIVAAAGGIALALSGAGMAAAATRTACVTPAQMSALVTYSLPALLEGVRNSCAAILPAGAYLRRSGDGLIGRYRAESAAYWPAARDAFKAITGEERALSELLGDDAAKLLLDSVLTGLVAKEIKPRDCGAIDEGLSLIAPLPAENLGRLVTLIVAKTGQADKMMPKDRDNPFRLCPAETGR